MKWETPRQAELGLDGATEGTIDSLRDEVRQWREAGWPRTSNATRELLEYWARGPGEGPVFILFYAQREAVETIIYLTEAVDPDHWMIRRLKDLANGWSRGLTRLALRMATGTGKTVVMACLIAWYAVNRRREHRADVHGLARNVDRVVVVCPGRTIKDRLSGLNPRVKHNIFDEWRLVPPTLRRRLTGMAVTILNWEKLQPRSGLEFQQMEIKGGKGMLSRSKAIAFAGGDQLDAEPETMDSMWARLLGSSTGARRRERVIVLNDEGHHCWERMDGEQPGVWMEALHALREREGCDFSQVIDLSATPIFINPKKSRVPAGTKSLRTSELVPWVVSEFALMESMEAGLVKIPQPPRGDNTAHESPLRNLFEANAGQKLTTRGGMALIRQGAEILFKDYKETFEAWQSIDDANTGHPVLIAVANNKINARAIFEMFGGSRNSAGRLEKSEFDLFSNVPRTGADTSECGMRTILVLSKTNNPEEGDASEQVAGGMLGVREVGKRGQAGKDEKASEDELRSVLQTVAQPGAPGQDVRCVVSVGMLTEGWDCQRVTHILGYRKFGSQLLCEQTMGRALRRRDYENLEEVARRDNGKVEPRLPAEYATVFGVPFAHTLEGTGKSPAPPGPKTEVRPLSNRLETFRIWVPDFSSYTVSASGVHVMLDRNRVREAWPVDGQEGREIQWVETGGPIGRVRILERPGEPDTDEGVWQLAAELVRLLEEDEDADDHVGRMRRGMLFSECLRVVREWLAHPNIAVMGKDLRCDGMQELAKSAILDALLVEGTPPRKVGVASDQARPLRSAGDWRPFLTGLKEIVSTRRSELNVAACHSELEGRIAESMDSSSLVAAFVRNHGPERIEVPYKYKGGWAKYVPDFFVRCHPTSSDLVPHVLLEGKGQPDERSEHKAWWTDHWWIPCANDVGAEYRQVWLRLETGSSDNVNGEIAHIIQKVSSE